MRKIKTKKAWKSFEITKVKLKPEQAVLSCCDSVDAPRGNRLVEGQQCADVQDCGRQGGSPLLVSS